MSQYPLVKEEAGAHAWSIMHHRASLYSSQPTQKQKDMMKAFLYENMQSVALLCSNCKQHIRDYLKKNPIIPALESKEKLSKYLCDFHNSVNQMNGKKTHNCDTILRPKEEAECKDCKVVVVKHDLKDSFEKFKEVSVKVFTSLCDKYKLPHPHIKFHECPSNPNTSCTSMLIDSRNNEIVEKPIVYLHPNQFGLRTIVHEFLHYIKQFSKDTLGGLDEHAVEKEAQALLFNEFPYDKREREEVRVPMVTNATKIIRKDPLESFPISKRIYDKHLMTIKRRDFGSQAQEEGGDLIFDMLGGVTQGRDEGVEEIDRELEASRRFREEKVNVLSFLDGMYAPFASIFGIRAADMNMYNSPTIISNATLTLMKSQLSPIGSLLATAVSSLGILGALALTKNGLGYGDKMLMNAFGSNMLYSTIDYMRPELKEDVIGGAMDLGEVVSTQQWNLVPKIIFGDSMIGSMLGESVATSTPQAVRTVQRSVAAAGTPNTISASAARRNTQRSAGLAPSDVGGPVRDVRTGAATGGNPAYRGRVTGGTGTNNQPVVDDDSVIIPSEEEVEYESSFGAHIADGSSGSFYTPASTGGEGMRRNSIRDIFEQDPGYDNFNDEYIEEEYVSIMKRSSRSKKVKSKLRKARQNTKFFKPGDAKSLEQYIFASMMTGAFTAAGAIIGTVIAKYLLKEVENNVPLPASLNAVIVKEST